MTEQADQIRDRRRLFALPGGSHDRLVRFLARFLPAGIGALLAVMVIAPIFPRGEVSFLLDRNKVAVTQERLRIDRAQYRGADAEGRPFSVVAGSALQRSARVQIVEMNDLSAQIQLKDGPAELKAPDGRYDLTRNAILIDGPVNFQAADGYRMTTNNVEIDLRRQHVSGTGGVTGSLPSGTFRAGAIEADLDERTVALTGRAHLTMQGKP